MKHKLQAFSDFANSLFPHEVSYLLKIQKFEQQENIDILKRIEHNSTHPDKKLDYDPDLDKRKYSYIKNWIQKRLAEIDVDLDYDLLSELDRKIRSDSIETTQEKGIISRIRNYRSTDFNFIKFYELLQSYRFYLLIRLRHQHYPVVNEFIEKEKEKYLWLKDIRQKIQQATVDIIDAYTLKGHESQKWEKFLTEVFYNEKIDGFNRYSAAVRLTFLYSDLNEHLRLQDLYSHLDMLFHEGRFYSKRILANYYSNRVILHIKFRENQKAEAYGYLSVRQKTNDYIHYVNVLSSTLLRNKKYQEALGLMQEAMPLLKKTSSMHNRIGFAGFFIRTLIKNKNAAGAVSYGESFLETYKDQILSYSRWHLFFSSLLYALAEQEKYPRLIHLIKRFSLLDKEDSYRAKGSFMPTISWLHSISLFQESKLSQQKLEDQLYQSALSISNNLHKLQLLNNLIAELEPFIPDIFARLKKRLNLK